MVQQNRTYLTQASQDTTQPNKLFGPLPTRIDSSRIPLGMQKYLSSISLSGKKKDFTDLLLKISTMVKDISMTFLLSHKRSMSMFQTDQDILNLLVLPWNAFLNCKKISTIPLSQINLLSRCHLNILAHLSTSSKVKSFTKTQECFSGSEPSNQVIYPYWPILVSSFL